MDISGEDPVFEMHTLFLEASPSTPPQLWIMAWGKVSSIVLARYRKGKLQLILHFACNNLITNSKVQNESLIVSLGSLYLEVHLRDWVFWGGVRHRWSRVFRQTQSFWEKRMLPYKATGFSPPGAFEVLSTGTSWPEPRIAVADSTFIGCST